MSDSEAKKKLNLEKASNFMRQYRDPTSRELKKLSANQFMEVWSHYDKDGESFQVSFSIFWRSQPWSIPPRPDPFGAVSRDTKPISYSSFQETATSKELNWMASCGNSCRVPTPQTSALRRVLSDQIPIIWRIRRDGNVAIKSVLTLISARGWEVINVIDIAFQVFSA